MENKKRHKRIFKLIGKISIIVFLVSLVIMLCFTFGSKSEVIEVPELIGISFIVSTIVSLICVIIATVLDVIEGVRIRKGAYFKECAIQILLFFVLYIIGDYFIEGVKGNWFEYIARAISVAVGIRAVGYIWAKEDRQESCN